MAYWKSQVPILSDAKQHFPRNINPGSCGNMIDFLCDKGFIVVRIGDPDVYINLKYKNKYIDYGNSKFKSNYLDSVLNANCSFFTERGSGAAWIVTVFDIPIVGLNLFIPFIFSPTGKSNEVIPPKNGCVEN